MRQACTRPTVSDWVEVNRQVPRLVDALPNGPDNFATVQVFLAGGVPEVMLELREPGFSTTTVKTVSGETLGACLDWWRDSPRRAELRQSPPGAGRHRSRRCDHVARSRPVARPHFHRLFSARQSRPRGLGHQEHRDRLRRLVGEDNVYRHIGPARVFVTEAAAIQAIKAGRVSQGDVIVLICSGPAGAGMQEIYQITSALKQLPTVSTSPC